MGFFSKLKFWKKHDNFDDFGLKGSGDELSGSHDLGLGGRDAGLGDSGLGDEGFGRFGPGQQTQPFQQPQYSYPPPSPMMPQQPQLQERASRDNMEILSSKLDVLKAKLESIEQRLINIERIAQGEQEGYRKRHSTR